MVEDRAAKVLALDPGNVDALTYFAAVERAGGAGVTVEVEREHVETAPNESLVSVAAAPEGERRQQARSWKLRAATSLARLWLKQGKKAEARSLLAEIYGWFTDGFDTTDLKEAKTLLEELA